MKETTPLSPTERLSGYAPLAARVIVGAIMAAHGGQKLAGGPSNFGGFLNLVVAISLVKVNVGLIAPPEAGAGAELDLALIAGFLVVLLAGPGRFALDGYLGAGRRDESSRRGSRRA